MKAIRRPCELLLVLILGSALGYVCPLRLRPAGGEAEPRPVPVPVPAPVPVKEYLSRLLCFAPAPLPRRPRAEAPARLPVRCVARWWGGPFRTTFGPGGDYVAESSCTWTGSWRLEGRLLTITESTGGGEVRCYRIEMDERLRRGKFVEGASGDFVLEPAEE